MYADVVVLTYQSPDINSFTYLVPKNFEKGIKVGQLVEVPFGSRTPMGIVMNLHADHLRGGNEAAPRDHLGGETKTDIKIKPLGNIIFLQPLLLPYQVELLKWISFYYLAPMVNCLNAILPELPRKLLIENSKWKESINHSPLTIHQTLVLVPTINRIPETLAKFPKAKNYALYHNELKPAEKFAVLTRILDGSVDYIFGSRSAIFAPCPRLAEIIIFDEHDGAYKDERSPYYDSLTVAQKIAKLTHAQIKIVDSSPKISTYFTHSTAHLRGDPEVQLRFHLGGGKGTRAKIISMKEERLAGNFSPISDFLLTKLKTSQNSLLFLNKKKESGSLYCKSCQSHLYLEKQPEVCPNCGSSDIFFNVLNITSLAKVVQKKIPSAKINLISENSQLSTLNSQLSSIDIATASIFYAPLVIKYDLVAHILPDTLLSRADFSSGEALYDQITNLKAQLKENGVLILQTYETENLIIKAAASGNYPSYYNEQLKLRRALFYPPFALLVKLTLKGKDNKKVKQKAEELIRSLRLTIDDQQSAILGPYTPLFFSKMPTFNIIIKYKLTSYSLKEKEEAVKKFQNLRNFKDVRVEVEPESIN